MKIVIDTLSNKKIKLDIDKNDKIKDIKLKIQEQEGLETKDFNLIENKKMLKDKELLDKKKNLFLILK